MKIYITCLSLYFILFSCGKNEKKATPNLNEEKDGTELLQNYFSKKIKETENKFKLSKEQINFLHRLNNGILHNTSEGYAKITEMPELLKLGERYRDFYKPQSDLDQYAFLQLTYTHVYAVSWVKRNKIDLKLQKSIKTFKNEYINCKQPNKNKCIIVTRLKIRKDMNQ